MYERHGAGFPNLRERNPWYKWLGIVSDFGTVAIQEYRDHKEEENHEDYDDDSFGSHASLYRLIAALSLSDVVIVAHSWVPDIIVHILNGDFRFFCDRVHCNLCNLSRNTSLKPSWNIRNSGRCLQRQSS